MSKHVCRIPHCDGTRLGHELAGEFPDETARLVDALDRIAHPEDYANPMRFSQQPEQGSP